MAFPFRKWLRDFSLAGLWNIFVDIYFSDTVFDDDDDDSIKKQWDCPVDLPSWAHRKSWSKWMLQELHHSEVSPIESDLHQNLQFLCELHS